MATIVEMKKAEVLSYLKTALQQLDAAQGRLSGRSELRNQINQLVDSPLGEIVDAISDGDFEDDFRLKS